MTTAKRKILFLIPSLAGGGAERTLINMLSKTDYSKYEVDLISVLEKGPYLKEVPPEVNLITLFKNENVLRALSYLQKKTGVDQVFRLMMKRKIKKQYDVGISFLDSNFTDFLFFTDKISKRYSWIHSSYKSYKNFYKFIKTLCIGISLYGTGIQSWMGYTLCQMIQGKNLLKYLAFSPRWK
jgi:hypothetical protein